MEGIVSTQLGSRYRIGRRPHGLVARGLEARVIWKRKKRGGVAGYFRVSSRDEL